MDFQAMINEQWNILNETIQAADEFKEAMKGAMILDGQTLPDKGKAKRLMQEAYSHFVTACGLLALSEECKDE